MKQTILISFDLGIQGDYEDMYSWLDKYKAIECGDGVAILTFEYNEDIAGELLEELERNVDFKNKDRIFMLFKDRNEKLKGRFIIGKRKRAPWSGYALAEEDLEIEW
ncbi:MAG: hypothetical protein HQ591_09395 [candidate division Zixibacteria bacterium]|nr:hypothetical protein [Candidatus Tariuqbacter arcticus]